MGSSNRSGRSKPGKKSQQDDCTRVGCNSRAEIRPALVQWIDSCEPVPNAEVEKNDLPEPQEIWQCGFIVHEDDDCLVVAGAMKPDLDTLDYVIAIPKVAVVAIYELKSNVISW